MQMILLPLLALSAMISGSEKHPSEPLKVEIQDSLKFGCDFHNPLLDHHYTADPTAVEYEGRLYVYGTNDQQQCDEVHPDVRLDSPDGELIASTLVDGNTSTKLLSRPKGIHDIVFIMSGETLKVDKWIIK